MGGRGKKKKKIVDLEGMVEEQEGWWQEPEELRESWLEKNVAAEGRWLF